MAPAEITLRLRSALYPISPIRFAPPPTVARPGPNRHQSLRRAGQIERPRWQHLALGQAAPRPAMPPCPDQNPTARLGISANSIVVPRGPPPMVKATAKDVRQTKNTTSKTPGTTLRSIGHSSHLATLRGVNPKEAASRNRSLGIFCQPLQY